MQRTPFIHTYPARKFWPAVRATRAYLYRTLVPRACRGFGIDPTDHTRACRVRTRLTVKGA